MPAVATVSVESIVEKISHMDLFETIDEEDFELSVLKPRSHPVWEEACTVLDNLIKVDNLHQRIKQNRGDVLTKIIEKRGISVPYKNLEDGNYRPEIGIEHRPTLDNSTEGSGDDSMDISKDVSDCEDRNFRIDDNSVAAKDLKKCPDLLYDVEIDPETWKKMRPHSVVYNEKGRYGNRRRYSVLRKGWTSLLHKICYKKTKLPCAYAFKRAKVYDTETKVYITIKGRCRECGNEFTGHCLNKPKNGQRVRISVTTSDTRGMPHTKKRPLAGEERVEVQKTLLHQKPAAWRCEATKDMDYGDEEPPDLYGLRVVNKARQEAKDKALGVHKVTDPMKSLQALKTNVEFSGTIREIAIDKFHSMYWSEEQLHLYKDLIKSGVPVTFDATGSVVEALPRPNGRSGAIFLYQGVIKGTAGILPVLQFLSEKQDTNMIAYALREWIRSGFPIPKETVTDFSLALLNGLCLAFNECTLKTYVRTCLRCLSGKKAPSIKPRCYVRVDIAHAIKMVTRWKCFKGKPSRVKDFYLRCIGIMTTSVTRKDFEKLVTALLVVAMCVNDGNDSECSSRQTFLLDSIRTFSVEESEEDSDGQLLAELFESLDDASSKDLPNFSSIKSYAEDTAKESLKLERANPYYCPEFVTPFLRLCQYFPLWTNVMAKISGTKHNTATSARSENYFNFLKHIEWRR